MSYTIDYRPADPILREQINGPGTHFYCEEDIVHTFTLVYKTQDLATDMKPDLTEWWGQNITDLRSWVSYYPQVAVAIIYQDSDAVLFKLRWYP